MSEPPPSAPESKQAFVDADPSFTPSHLRHLNNPTFSLAGEPALVADCYSLNSWDTAAPSPLRLEVPSKHTLLVQGGQFDKELLEAIDTGDHAAALDISRPPWDLVSLRSTTLRLPCCDVTAFASSSSMA